ncbi:MAG: tRNA (adenosine(37)-N6)-threonylcarbamoyltransferase complex ATPase subunit type 1 TsaE [Patescibacteria group bacterium]|nr:tRNA (adenosine(37)-N6)-threonylcarbamoyltransferase complex ATPase subunit type 1 TsaE [Patescibacteria group bacterium]MDD5294487.1 tRNA (adenosine(37)-N6)-threonylcarbamoyltransferase complex ATPase subunit type 1 TsaE [Patescibacteria group bacterium]MDD5554329.1 tRNA (adenosine(37)-N6)-threonylcarbamoyltransferase complex ATPase subunit type 1 TsaE [Patescibacteria group bacterium]
MTHIVTHSEKETLALAKKYAKTLRGGTILGLIGNLGAGKTVFIKGLASGLGLKKNITSPTFVIMKVYPVKKGKVKNFVHIDAYRIKEGRDLIAIGAQEYLNWPDTLTVIEWADRIKKVLPEKIRFIKIKILAGEKRKISLN